MAKNKGSIRGLDAIFLDNSFPEDEEVTTERRTVQISDIDTKPDQPRKNFDAAALAGLAESISANGLLQPILVRKVGERFEIIAGERRFRASKLEGLLEIPVIVTEADDATAAKYALIENLQREDLNPYEEAAAYQKLMSEYDLSQEEISTQIGKSRSAIANAVRLLDLPPEVVKMLTDGIKGRIIADDNRCTGDGDDLTNHIALGSSRDVIPGNGEFAGQGAVCHNTSDGAGQGGGNALHPTGGGHAVAVVAGTVTVLPFRRTEFSGSGRTAAVGGQPIYPVERGLSALLRRHLGRAAVNAADDAARGPASRRRTVVSVSVAMDTPHPDGCRGSLCRRIAVHPTHRLLSLRRISANLPAR